MCRVLNESTEKYAAMGTMACVDLHFLSCQPVVEYCKVAVICERPAGQKALATAEAREIINVRVELICGCLVTGVHIPQSEVVFRLLRRYNKIAHFVAIQNCHIGLPTAFVQDFSGFLDVSSGLILVRY